MPAITGAAAGSDVAREVAGASPSASASALASTATSAPASTSAPQRRAFFRLGAQELRGPLLRLRHPALPEMRLALQVLDLSIGGCAAWLPDDVPPLEPGTRWRDVVLELGTADELHAALVLQHITCLAHEPGGQRLGCEWVWHESGDERALQRWLDRAQKRARRMRLPWSEP